MTSKREYSAGGVLVRRHESEWWVAAIKPKGRTVLALPKGHIEAGETAGETAVREVLEETGVLGEVLADLGEIRYVYRFQGRTVLKTVAFFLLEYQSGTMDAISESMRQEVDQAQWVRLAEAPSLLTYQGELLALKLAAEFLNRYAVPKEPAGITSDSE